MKLKDKIALITGAGSGIGQAIALSFAREGAKVVVNDIVQPKIDSTICMLEKTSSEHLGVKADVASVSEVKAMFARIVDRFGTLDILINNAGIVILPERVQQNCRTSLELLRNTGASRVSLEATRYMTDEAWDRLLRVHLYGTFHCTREALNIMEDRGHGKIINMASICGMSGCAGDPGYSAAKAGIIGFTKSVAAEVIGTGVYVNAIAPGYLDTPLQNGILFPEILESFVARTPLGRLGLAEEIAPLAVFLASGDSNFMVGQVVSPNGGVLL